MHECELTTGEIRDRVALRSRNPLTKHTFSLHSWQSDAAFTVYSEVLIFVGLPLFYFIFFRNLLNTVCDAKI